MANEIKTVCSLTVANGNFSSTQGGVQRSCDQATAGGDVPGTVSIGTSEEDISLSELTTLGWIYMRNTSLTAYVNWGPKSGGVMVGIGRLEAGEEALFRLLPGVTLRMVASAANTKVKIAAQED